MDIIESSSFVGFLLSILSLNAISPGVNPPSPTTLEACDSDDVTG